MEQNATFFCHLTNDVESLLFLVTEVNPFTGFSRVAEKVDKKFVEFMTTGKKIGAKKKHGTSIPKKSQEIKISICSIVFLQ